MLKLFPASSTLARTGRALPPFADPAVISDSRRAIMFASQIIAARGPACTPRDSDVGGASKPRIKTDVEQVSAVRIGDFVEDGRYAGAGVDIDAGNRLVELIKPLVRATARSGAGAEIGGFGGLFDLKAAGFTDPDSGCRDRRRRHQSQDRDRNRATRYDRHRSCRHVGQRPCRAGRRTAVLSRLFRLRQTRSGDRGDGGKGRRGGLPRGRLRAYRRRNCGNAWSLSARRLRPRRVCGRRGRAKRHPTARRHRCRRRCGRARGERRAFQWVFIGQKDRRRCRPEVAGARAVRTRAEPGRGAADADAALRALLPSRDTRQQGGQSAGAHHRRRLDRKYSARSAARTCRAPAARSRASLAGIQMARRDRQCRRKGNAADIQLRHWHGGRA